MFSTPQWATTICDLFPTTTEKWSWSDVGAVKENDAEEGDIHSAKNYDDF